MRALWALILIGILTLVTSKLDQTVGTGVQEVQKGGVAITEEGLRKTADWAKQQGPVIAAEAQVRYDNEVSPLVSELVNETTRTLNKK